MYTSQDLDIYKEMLQEKLDDGIHENFFNQWLFYKAIIN